MTSLRRTATTTTSGADPLSSCRCPLVLPWLTDGGSLGDDVLEIGPGPGRTTDLLRERAPHVTALELDAALAEALAARLTGSNVEVLHGDGADTGLQAERFSAVMCFHMLHHMPSADLQDRLFAKVFRVLRPGGTFLVADARRPEERAGLRTRRPPQDALRDDSSEAT